MNEGFFVAQKLADGSLGRPVGNDDGAIMLFEELERAAAVRLSLLEESSDLAVFKVNLVFVGEVIL